MQVCDEKMMFDAILAPGATVSRQRHESSSHTTKMATATHIRNGTFPPPFVLKFQDSLTDVFLFGQALSVLDLRAL
jgi:uncharacterized protein YdiU (UPF0061 family)